MTTLNNCIGNFIGGEIIQPAADASLLENIEPATGQVYGHLIDSDNADLEAAVAAAEGALPHWRALEPDQRARHLERIADLIEENLDTLAEAESRDNGKPLALARRVDIPRAAANFRFFARAITQFASESHAMDGRAINYTLRAPLGIVGCISPWNLPLYLFTWKIAPALAAGNCVIAKPSEVTPTTAGMLADICRRAGLPAGVLNILHGRGNGIGSALVAHPKIKAISFTGGTATGARIAAAAAPSFKKLSLELGGKNPTLVFADCDWEKTLDGVLRAALTNQGQICLCGSRIYVEASIYAEFKAALLERVAKLRIGDPLTEVDQGALVSAAHMDKVLNAIAQAKEDGGQILCGGERLQIDGRCRDGYFVAPTLIEGLPIDCRTNQKEIFGPVATIQPFSDEKEALQLANGTGYGLATSLWSQNLSRCHRLAEQLDFGIVWINCWMQRDLRTPFGGMKNSGVGREGGWEALRFFTEAKNVCVDYT
ncbi:aminomuconate-semialdehyde/2-hydroxymuconate-6-semialdehyde dehydrogenase [Microbulbifer donghaiensis]|uniref:Aminomuconate-semialdehyde/2-hydroxymuconate-6-semialdehyde dehydrogenase n=1 Tax=Microbulbifer donghaiensis TaxID=494016 RepID=A0A1M5CEA8_9GAMM|nr:aldehyde dehydrogenase [Microbulbifer donghaiensis]SHF53065.1 aminomuconate-semialdehyde/2-hydroxymuconate-6-semialdehyde dehydrogenase [Microbulbifer donghaiensis]